jgi:para-nitrobenzyl esterase
MTGEITMRLSLLVACSIFATSALAQPGTRVTIDTGMLRGQAAEGVVAYKGIPFAAPPVGPLRWRAPQPAARWQGERDAIAYAHDCMQLPFPSDAAPLGTPPAEDCLYANVWRPAAAGAKRPVLVWIYGGGFVNGGSSPPTYSGAALARQGIVFVSFNYRLGRFGTFAHPALAKADPDKGLRANYGYLDQIAALHWVKRNIAAFGGDPAQVTIIGESAGGMSVHALVTSPMAKGLFQRAVIQSGGPDDGPPTTLATAEAAGVAFAATQGIAADDPQALEKLRALPADKVVDGLNLAALFAAKAGPATFTRPVVDGTIAVAPVAAYEAGRFARVPVMVGATSDDIGGPSGYMIQGARKVADLLTRQRVPVHYYRFSYVATSVRTPATKGAGHASEIPFFFDTADVKYGAATSAADRQAARTASAYLVNFVKRGTPDGAGLPVWPVYDAATRPMLDLDAQGGAAVVRDPAP